MKKFKPAFTLAEVLVTLMIIGVIAAMTIPGLRKNTEMRELAVGCKKAYTSLAQAMLLAEQENGTSKRWPNKASDVNAIWKNISPYLNISKDCTITGTSDCWTEGIILPLKGSGKAANFVDNKGYGQGKVAFKLADGTNGTFDITVPGKKEDPANPGAEVPDGIVNSYLFYIDVNGDKKPNTLGIDIFGFADYADGNGLVPLGTGLEPVVGEDGAKKPNDGDCKIDNEGTQCAAKVVREGAINY